MLVEEIKSSVLSCPCVQKSIDTGLLSRAMRSNVVRPSVNALCSQSVFTTLKKEWTMTFTYSMVVFCFLDISSLFVGCFSSRIIIWIEVKLVFSWNRRVEWKNVQALRRQVLLSINHWYMCVFTSSKNRFEQKRARERKRKTKASKITPLSTQVLFAMPYHSQLVPWDNVFAVLDGSTWTRSFARDRIVSFVRWNFVWTNSFCSITS